MCRFGFGQWQPAAFFWLLLVYCGPPPEWHFASSHCMCGALLLRMCRRSGPRTASWQDVTIHTKDNVYLRAWFVDVGNGSKKCVVVLHGIADSRAGSAGFAPFFLQHGYSVLLPDSRAHGQSGGQFVTYGLLEKYDVLEWANWLQKAGCTELYALGESLGASIVIQAAALKPVFRAIVAECAYADLRKIAAYRVEQMLPFPLAINRCFSTLVVASGITYARLRYGFDFNEVSPVASIRRTVTPVLLIHGLKDTRTPPGHSQALLAANPQMVLWLVPDSGHTNASATHPQEFQDRVLGWFGQHK
jgi:uncharacterized protein